MKKIQNIKALPGFAELNPGDQITFNNFKKIIAETYEKYGFIPLDTPTIEREEILFAKTGGDTAQEVYKIKKGDNDLALRFDLTVPLARYVAANYSEINFPFRRYQIEKVFRGERSQKGRFREFYQCDIDIIGDGGLDLKNDAEIPSVIYSVLSKLNIGPFVIKINNRKILTGFIDSFGFSDRATEVLRIVDKKAKITQEEMVNQLAEIGLNQNQIASLYELITLSGSNQAILEKLEALKIENQEFLQGIDELKQVISFIDLFNIPKDYYQIDISISRGLDYYTGTVYETYSVDYPEFGSICSGGRYENLAEFYTSKKLPGVGISIGLTRLFYQMKEAKLINGDAKTSSEVLILPLVQDLTEVVKLANNLRRSNIKTEIYLEDQNMKKKMNYANKIGVQYVLLMGEDEIKSGKLSLKNMRNGEQVSLTEKELVSLLKSLRLKKL